MKYEINDSKAINRIIGFMLGLSMAVYSIQSIVLSQLSIPLIIITVIVTIAVMMWLYSEHYAVVQNFVSENYCRFLLVVLGAFAIVKESHTQKSASVYAEVSSIIPVNIYRLRWYLLAIPALSFIGILATRYLINVTRDVFAQITKSEKKIYFVLSVMLSIIIVSSYIVSPMWYRQYDMVYSIDSGTYFAKRCSNFMYYEVQHPLLTGLAFPVYSIVKFVVSLLNIPQVQSGLIAAIIQLLNAQMLLVTGLMLRVISGNRMVWLIYLVSFPSILFTFFFEKFHICVYLLVMFVYLIHKGEGKREVVCALSIGALPTNVPILAAIVLFNTEWKSRIKEFCRVIVTGVAMAFVMGRGFVFNIVETYNQMHDVHSFFGVSKYALIDRVYSTLSMMGGTLFALPSQAGDKYLWTDLFKPPSIICSFVIFTILLGIIVSWNKKITRLGLIWLITAFLLFVVLQWTPHITPLFGLVFSWAFIILFVEGFDYIIRKCKIRRRIAYAFLVSLMLVSNIAVLIDIQLFLNTIK